MSGNFRDVDVPFGVWVAASRHTHRDRDGLLHPAVTYDCHLMRRVNDGGHQPLGKGKARLGAACVDVDDAPAGQKSCGRQRTWVSRVQ